MAWSVSGSRKSIASAILGVAGPSWGIPVPSHQRFVSCARPAADKSAGVKAVAAIPLKRSLREKPDRIVARSLKILVPAPVFGESS